ncbi:MAG: hypothetical protein PCFJNLEI_00614 [Verrucomicrobiae bacterium]|nr:hypothetical protein [Verrucomicrobiae bacterium]
MIKGIETWLAIKGTPLTGTREQTPTGFVLRTTGARAVELRVTAAGNRVQLEIHEPVPEGTTLPERMRVAAGAPPLQIVPELFALDVQDKGSGLVLPMMEGMWLSASGVTAQATFKLFYVAGLTMGFWAACRPGRGTVVGICEHPYLQFQLVGTPQGQRWIPEWLRDPTGVPLRMEIVFLDGEHWLDAAREFRRVELARKKLIPLSQRPAARNLVGGANIKFHNYSRRDGQPERCSNTFAQVAEHCRELQATGVDRAMAIFWGWGKEGYDRLHPDFLPANERAGGDVALRAASDAIKALGYSVGGHDNYQDIYQVAPSFGDGESVCVTAEGKLQAGGIWTGGQCYIQCSAEALRFAQRNLPEMKRRYGWDALFVDTTTAVHLYECYSDRHPRSRHDDLQDKIALMDYARAMFGVFGSEAGTSWGVEHMDYWEGVLQIPYAETGAKGWTVEMGARPVPIFGAVYRDILTAYQHQSCSQAENAPLMFLAALRSGQPPYYFFNGDFWAKNAGFVRKSFAVLGHLHRLTVDAVVAGHGWLTTDGTVEKTVLSDGTEIVVNWSVQPFAFDGVRLPGNGFFVRGPKIVAFWAEEVAGMKFTPPLWASIREDATFTERPVEAAQLKQLRELLG